MSDRSRPRSRFDLDEPPRSRFDQDDSAPRSRFDPDEAAPRSRFDRGESPPRSRFDRRSRSPSTRESESRRNRSPLLREASDSPSTVGSQPRPDPAAAAAAAKAAAAKINAQINAKKAVQHVDVPPIRSSSVASPATPKTPSNNTGKPASQDVYQQDGDFIRDIEINDLRNRYTLTKGAMQKKLHSFIKDETGADVTTRGEYYPDKSMATATSPPLYLHITSVSKDGLEAAIQMINEMMKQDLPNLVDERRFRRRDPDVVERDDQGRRKWPEEKIPVDLEPITGFNLRAQVVGRGGDNVKYIQAETGCKVQIKGRGSGFREPHTNDESDEPMYLHIAGPKPEGVQYAKELCDGLLKKVKEDYQAFKDRPPQHRYGDGYSNGRSDYNDRNERDRNYSYSRGSAYSGYNSRDSYGAPGTQSVQPVGANSASYGDADVNAFMAWAEYYRQNPSEDPYAAQGGFANAWYWYSQSHGQLAQGAQNSPAPGVQAAALPPPPPSEPGPPPPPPSGSPGGYNAVPPPPGI